MVIVVGNATSRNARVIRDGSDTKLNKEPKKTSKLPTLLPLNPKRPDGTDSVVLAVYAPFGTDEVLSMFPDGTRKPIGQQPLVSELRKVARLGVHVSALIDLFDDFSYLVEIPAGLPGQLRVYSTWKQDMTSPYALEGFLRHTLQRHPCAALVLAIEGHGQDSSRISTRRQSRR